MNYDLRMRQTTDRKPRVPYIEPSPSGEHLLAEDIGRLLGISAAAVRDRCRKGTMVAAHRTVGGARIFHRPGVLACGWSKVEALLKSGLSVEALKDGLYFTKAGE